MGGVQATIITTKTKLNLPIRQKILYKTGVVKVGQSKQRELKDKHGSTTTAALFEKPYNGGENDLKMEDNGNISNTIQHGEED